MTSQPVLRLFAGGIATETNVHSPLPTGLRDFSVAQSEDSPEMRSQLSGGTVFVRYANAAAAAGCFYAQGLYACAKPAGVTTRVAYETLRDSLLEDLRSAPGPRTGDHAREAVANLGPALADRSSPSAVSLAHLEVHAAINLVAFGRRLGGMMTRNPGIYLGLADMDYVQQSGYDPLKHLELIDELASGDEARALAAMDKHALRGDAAEHQHGA